jgi:hypothetical protein
METAILNFFCALQFLFSAAYLAVAAGLSFDSIRQTLAFWWREKQRRKREAGEVESMRRSLAAAVVFDDYAQGLNDDELLEKLSAAATRFEPEAGSLLDELVRRFAVYADCWGDAAHLHFNDFHRNGSRADYAAVDFTDSYGKPVLMFTDLVSGRSVYLSWGAAEYLSKALDCYCREQNERAANNG